MGYFRYPGSQKALDEELLRWGFGECFCEIEIFDSWGPYFVISENDNGTN